MLQGDGGRLGEGEQMSLALRHGWRSRPEANHPEVETLKDLAGVFARFVYYAYLWLLIFALLPLVWGWRPVVVTSGSMGPTVRTGDVVVAMPYDGQDIGVGTVIVFSQNDKLVTHRISEVRDDGTFLTAGDANQGQDSSPVAPSQVEGVGRILVPSVGLPIAWVGNNDWYPLAYFGILLIGFGLFMRARRGRRIRWESGPKATSIAERLKHLERKKPVPDRASEPQAIAGHESSRPPDDSDPGDEASDPYGRIDLHDALH
jgi:signal peptidase